VPDSAALLIEAGGLRIFHSGDFKLDPDPPDGETTDVAGITAAVGGGVDLALVDSTTKNGVGIALSERYANYALNSVYNSGLLCIGITTESFALLNSCDARQHVECFRYFLDHRFTYDWFAGRESVQHCVVT